MRNTRTDPGPGEWARPAGRHALNEDAVLTPIFHALSHSGWRSRQHDPAASAAARPAAPVDPVTAFRRDPLSAPIPEQALSAPVLRAARRRRAAHALPEAPAGRHHRLVVPIGQTGH